MKLINLKKIDFNKNLQLCCCFLKKQHQFTPFKKNPSTITGCEEKQKNTF